MAGKNHCVKFAKRPGTNGTPEEDNFSYEECDYPELGSNEMLVKSLYLSVDPIQRKQMNEKSGLEPIFAPFQIGDVIYGLYGVGVVTESKLDGFKPGDVVINSELNGWPWQLYFKTSNDDGKFVHVNLTDDDLKYEITYYGLPGLTIFLGLQEQGGILENNGKGKSFVVSGAAGSCGHIAGQVALLNGCSPVVGICGTDEKCKILKEKLKFTDTINYKVDNVDEKLKEACPNGVDVYFDNVGGEIADKVLMNMNENGRVILCGQIASYNSEAEYPEKLSSEVSSYVKEKNIQREAFVSLIHKEQFARVRKELYKLKHDSGVQVLDTVHNGLENMGRAFCCMMKGVNIGKQLVKVGDL